MMFEDFQDGHFGGHLRYRTRTILAIPNLYASESSRQVWAQSALRFRRRSFEEFQDGLNGGHLGCRNGKTLAVLNHNISPMLPTKFQLNPTYRSRADFQAGHNGGNLGYWNGTNLAILNFHVTQMPPTKAGLNPTYRSGADMLWRFSRWPPVGPSWIPERNEFSNSESLCCSDAAHKVSAQSNL